MSNARSRNFSTIVYPDSAPENWKQILADEHIDCIISPFHDQDLNADGEPKKAHTHVMILFSSLKSVAQAKEIFDKIGGVGCEVVNSMRSMARYFCHLDNSDKHQYDKSQVTVFGDLDYLEIISSAADELKLQRDILQIIDDNDIILFSDLVDILSSWPKYSEHFRFLSRKNTIFFATYLKSREYKIRLSVEASRNKQFTAQPSGENKPTEV